MPSSSSTEISGAKSEEKITTYSPRFGTAEAVRIYDAASKPAWPYINAILDTFQMTFDEKKISATQNGDKLRGCTFLDIGCGPGSYTLNHLLPRLPPSCHKVVAVDNSEAMLEFARKNNADPRIEYRQLDLTKEDDVQRLLLEQGPFERVYSFLTLHWMADQLQALKNIKALMAPGAECFLFFSDMISLFDIFAAMMKSQRWKKYSHLLQRFLPPTSSMKDMGDLRSYLANLVAGTNLIPLACEVVRTPIVLGCSRESCIDIFVMLNPVYPLLKDEEKPELRKFTDDFVKDVKERITWEDEKDRTFLVIHAYKREN